jgi:hypothetical protein
MTWKAFHANHVSSVTETAIWAIDWSDVRAFAVFACWADCAGGLAGDPDRVEAWSAEDWWGIFSGAGMACWTCCA